MADHEDISPHLDYGMPGQGLLRSVFRCEGTYDATIGGFIERRKQDELFYVEELEPGLYEIQRLNPSMLPDGRRVRVSEEELLSRFKPEVELYVKHVAPKMEALSRSLDRADQHRERGEHYSAEMEYGEALKVDEDNVRATFGLGLTYLSRQDLNKAGEVFQKLVGMELPFRAVHKHMFNEFGIALRKSRMYEEALKFYTRAVDLASDDEHIFFNIARTFYEMGDWPGCAKYLTLCLELNRGVEEARRFCRHLVEKGTKEGDILAHINEAGAEAEDRFDAVSLISRLQQAAGLSSAEIREDALRIKRSLAQAELRRTRTKENRSMDFNLDKVR